MNGRSVIVIIACAMTACSSAPRNERLPVKVEIVRTDSGYQLLRGGAPYTIKGAGMAVDDIVRFASNGGNSIRNWSTSADYQDAGDLLDAAHANGVTVALCLDVASERHGFDYGDAGAVAAQRARLREEVLRYRDHPALLVWIIGNELNHSYTDARVYDAVNDIAKMIHELDPNHPTTTTVAGFEAQVVADIADRAPALDFVSFQLYGELFGLLDRLRESRFDQPFMITEWGAIGYWEMETTSWGTPTEMTSSDKAEIFLRGHQEVLASLEGQLLGSYVFLWGQKQERTPTWFGMFTESGQPTEAVDVMHYLWTGRWPADRAPRVRSMLLDGRSAKQSVILEAGGSYVAELDAVDREGSALVYEWEVKRESESTNVGGDREEPIPSLDGMLAQPGAAKTGLTVSQPGRYRIFAYAYDEHGHAAHANIPFLVEPKSD